MRPELATMSTRKSPRLISRKEEEETPIRRSRRRKKQKLLVVEEEEESYSSEFLPSTTKRLNAKGKWNRSRHAPLRSAKAKKLARREHFPTENVFQQDEYQSVPPPADSPPQLETAGDSDSPAREGTNSHLSIVAARPARSIISLGLTEIANMCRDDEGSGDEVSSVGPGQGPPPAHGYGLRPEYLPVWRQVLAEYGDIASSCTLVNMKFRSMSLHSVLDIIIDLNHTNFDRVDKDFLRDALVIVNDASQKGLEVGWLQKWLKQIHDAKGLIGQSKMLKQKRERNEKANEDAERETRECEAERAAVEARLRAVCEREAAIKETLAKTRNEGSQIREEISQVRAVVNHFLSFPSLADGLFRRAGLN